MTGRPRAIRRRLTIPGLLVGLACFASQGVLHGQDRFFRRYAPADGFHSVPVYALAQDARGFLFAGGQNGLVRYDGTEFQPWASQTIGEPVVSIAVSPTDRLVVLTESGRTYEVGDNEARPIAGPQRAELGLSADLTFDRDGRLWVIRGGRVAYLREGNWRDLPAEAFGGERPLRLRTAPDRGIVAATDGGIWQLDSRMVARKIVASPRPADFLFLPDGALAVLEAETGQVREMRDGTLRRVVAPFSSPASPRPISLARRGETLWVSYDRYLVGIRTDRPPEILGTEHGIESGGPVFVDQEGSLWLGTFTSLLQYPEPETRIWNEMSGLRSQHTRFLGRSGGALWITTWGGAGLLVSGTDAPSIRWAEDWVARDEVCEDGDGGVWLAAEDALLQLRESRVVRRHPADAIVSFRCAVGPEGGMWLAFSGRLMRADSAGRLRQVAAPPLPERAEPVLKLLRDSQTGLWIGGEGTLCRGDVASSASIAEWDCVERPEVGAIAGLTETRSGRIWAATSRAGLLEARAGEWEEPAGNAPLPSEFLFNLVPSPAGGVWILGREMAWRVEEAAGGDGPWEVLERLDEWHGLPVRGGRDLHEDADGTLWITTSHGVVEVPPVARLTRMDPPRVAMVRALVDERPVDPSEALVVPHGRHGLELRFSALTFRDPGLVRYQVRLSPGEPWTEVAGRPWFRWVDLRPGSYEAAVRASLDRSRWTPEPATFAFRVLPPWYGTAWGMATLGLAVGLLLWLGHRTRIRYVLGVERERTRIAMDLHDEMGSALGSIGILSGLLVGSGERDERRRELAQRIGRTAEELGTALSHIIWSLDAGPGTLGELAARLADAGGGLFSNRRVRFRTEFADTWPDTRIPARRLRNLLLIGLEALHNAGRHSGAANVTLRLRPCERGEWELRIMDDGVGFNPATQGGEGRGLGTMRRRAAEIGTTLRWEDRASGGTSVVLVFSLGPYPARLGARFGARVARGWGRAAHESAKDRSG